MLGLFYTFKAKNLFGDKCLSNFVRGRFNLYRGMINLSGGKVNLSGIV